MASLKQDNLRNTCVNLAAIGPAVVMSVQGTKAEGTDPDLPVYIAAKDAAGHVKVFLVDASGNVQVAVQDPVKADIALIKTSVQILDDGVKAAGDNTDKVYVLGATDNTGKVRALLVDASNFLRVSVEDPVKSDIQTLATVIKADAAATTNGAVISGALTGAGTAKKITVAANGEVYTINYAEYKLVPAAIADGQLSRLQCDTNGFLRISALDIALNAIKMMGNVAHDAVDTGYPLKVGAFAVSSQPAAVAANDRVNLIATLFGELITAGYDYGSNANRTEEVDPLNQQYAEEELIDTTNIPMGTYYYPSSAGALMGGYKDLSIGFELSGGVTMTMEATLDDAAVPDWRDITKAGFELYTNTNNNASYIDTGGILDYDNLNVKKWRVKIVTSDGTNAVQLHTRRKAL